LLQPYPRRALTPQTENFNKRLSTARKCIECAFGILYSKWRFLAKDIETLPHRASCLIKCAWVLHNFVRERDGDSDLDYIEMTGQLNEEDGGSVDAQGEGRHNNRFSQAASTVRSEFTKYFWDLGH
jgi:hypothetical protein